MFHPSQDLSVWLELTSREQLISTPTWSHSQNSLIAAEALSLKISFHRLSPKRSQSAPEQSWAMQWNVESCFETDRNPMENETTTWSESPYQVKVIAEQILVSKRNPKNRTVRITVRDPSRWLNYMSKVIWDRKIITEFTRSINSTRIG